MKVFLLPGIIICAALAIFQQTGTPTILNFISPPDTLGLAQKLADARTDFLAGKYPESRHKAETVRKEYTHAFGATSPEVATADLLISRLEMAYGEFDTSKKRLENCLKNLPPYSSEAAEAWLELASWNVSMENSSKADSCFTLAQLALDACPTGRRKAENEAFFHFYKGVNHFGKVEYHFAATEYAAADSCFRQLALSAQASQALAQRGMTSMLLTRLSDGLAQATAALKTLPPDHPAEISVRSNLGALLCESGQTFAGLKCLDTALLCVRRFGLEKSLSGLSARGNRANSLSLWGLNRQARDEFAIILTLLNHLPETHSQWIHRLNGAGDAAFALGEFSEAIRYYRQALALNLRREPPNLESLGTTRNNLGKALTAADSVGEAAQLFRQTMTDWAGSPWVFMPLSNLGLVHYRSDKLDSARICFSASLQMLDALIPSGQSLYHIQNYQNLARVFIRQSKPDEAGEHLRKAFSANAATAVSPPQVALSPEFFLHTQALQGQALRLKFRQRGDASALRQSAQRYEVAFSTLSFLRENLSLDEATAALELDKKLFFEGALQTFHLLAEKFPAEKQHWQQKMWDYTEQSKAILLAAQVRRSGFAISSDLQKHEDALKSEMRGLESVRASLLTAGFTAADSIFRKTDADLARVRQNLADLYQKMPDEYKKTMRSWEIASPEILKNELPGGAAMLDYFVGDSVAFAFVLRQGMELKTVKIPLNFNLQKTIQTYREGIIHSHEYANPLPGKTKQQHLNDYLETAQLLYQKLVQPVEAWLPKGGHLLLVPDGPLGNLPFEALLTQKIPDGEIKDLAALPYFFKKNVISYSPSATLWQEMRTKIHRQQPENEVLALAPWFFGETDDCRGLRGGDGFDEMPCSKKEVDFVLRQFGGNSEKHLGFEASKAFFLKNAGRFRVIHLALHGKAGDQNAPGKLFFTQKNANGNPDPDPLHLPEIYALTLNADLITLSACETGIGETRPGEGVLSLARAFAYAGAKNILTTSWKVDGPTTGSIMQDFYEKRAALGNAGALQRARELWLAAHSGSGGAHPFYWAGCFLIGDAR